MLQPWMKRCKIAPCTWPDKLEEQNKLINKFINFKRKLSNKIISKDGLLEVEIPPKNKKKGVPAQKHTPKTKTVSKNKKEQKSPSKSKVKNVTYGTKRKSKVAFSPSPPKASQNISSDEDSCDEDDNVIMKFLMKSAPKRKKGKK